MDKQENKENILDKIFPFYKVFQKKKGIIVNAEQAWIESTYGFGSYKNIEDRIKEKREYINLCIQSKFKQVYQNGDSSNSSYHCVVDIEEDLASHVDTIFEPFIANGFTIIDLSKQVEEIDEPNVYLISWKNVFKNKPVDTNNQKTELIED